MSAAKTTNAINTIWEKIWLTEAKWLYRPVCLCLFQCLMSAEYQSITILVRITIVEKFNWNHIWFSTYSIVKIKFSKTYSKLCSMGGQRWWQQHITFTHSGCAIGNADLIYSKSICTWSLEFTRGRAPFSQILKSNQDKDDNIMEHLQGGEWEDYE